jgi:dCMP deaminase
MTDVTLLLYMPVIHRGYFDFLVSHHRNADACLVIGEKAIAGLGPEAEYLRKKDFAIRGLPSSIIVDFIRANFLFETVAELDEGTAKACGGTRLVGPDEDITRLAAERFFPGVPTAFDGSVRLRYDRKGVERIDPVPAASVTSEEAHQALMGKAEELAEKSKDWWLHVGALVARDGRVLFAAWNRAMPDADMPGALGDPRSLFSRGQGTDDTLVHHAERGVVAQAARAGVSLLGADAYVTHFPCVPCASDLAEAGIGRLFFLKGYSRLESASVLETRGVEIIRVIPAGGAT